MYYFIVSILILLIFSSPYENRKNVETREHAKTVKIRKTHRSCDAIVLSLWRTSRNKSAPETIERNAYEGNDH